MDEVPLFFVGIVINFWIINYWLEEIFFRRRIIGVGFGPHRHRNITQISTKRVGVREISGDNDIRVIEVLTTLPMKELYNIIWIGSKEQWHSTRLVDRVPCDASEGKTEATNKHKAKATSSAGRRPAAKIPQPDD